jgi:DNA-binding SARP family transcriptional activator/ABC-type cobalamin/Fe3+-siderophores transport system ATPase subunit
MGRLRITLFGGISVQLAAGTSIALPGKAQALVGYLALQGGKAQPRDKLTAILWPDVPHQRARHNLRQLLLLVRQALPAESLEETGDGVVLDTAVVEVDATELERLARMGDTDALTQAAALYHGDLLAGLGQQSETFEAWLLPERERLRELAVEVFSRLLGHQVNASTVGAAIQTAARLLALDPTHEPAHRALMRLYVHQGRRAAALRQYQMCVSILQRELGAEPEAATREVYQEIVQRRHEPDRDAPARARQLSAKSTAGEAGPRVRSETVNVETPLIGRSAELMVLHGALEDARSGQGRIVVLLGEAGIGKSRLVAEILTEARQRNGRVLFGRAYESAQILPFGPWVDAVRNTGLLAEDVTLSGLSPIWRAELARLFPELAGPDLPAPSDDYLHLFESLVHLIAHVAAARPITIVLEDVHWADEMSVRLLSFVGRRVQAWRVLVVATAREEELADADVLRRVLEELRSEGHDEVQLSPLSHSDTSVLVQSLMAAATDSQAVARLTAQVWATSEGNPFVAVEALRALREGMKLQAWARLTVPQRVRDLVTARVERLSDRARQLLAVAAVVGREFDFTLLQRASGLTERDAAAGVEELVRRRMLHGVDDGFDFTHDRIREVVYSGLLPPRRKLLHGDVATTLETLTAQAFEPPAAALGTHYRHAEVWDKATFYLRQAGLKALARSSNREASAHFEQALSALSHVPETRQTLEHAIDLRFDLRTSLFPLGEVLRVLTYLQEADELTRTLNDHRRIGQLSVYMSHILHVTGRPNEARDFGETARGLGKTLGDLSIGVGGTFYKGAACYFAGDYEPALGLLRETVECLRGDLGRDRYGLVGLPAVMARAYLTWIYAERGEFEAALAHGHEGLRLAETVDHPYSLIIACWGLLYLHASRQELEQTSQVGERALALARAWDLPLPSAITAGIMGHAYVVGGRTVDGLALLEESVRLHESSGLVYFHSLIVSYLAEANSLAGRHDDARVFGEQALTLTRQRGERGFEAWSLRALGEIAASTDRPNIERAEGYYREALALATERGMRLLAALCHLGLARVSRRTRDTDHETHLAIAVKEFREMAMPFWLERTETVPER